MTPDNNPATEAVIKQHRGPSFVWILPLVAALIAAWLAWQSYQDAGITIEVQFESAEGLEAEKTKVLFRGLPSGTIKQLRLNEDLKGVTAIIEMASEAEPLLHENTRFWLVKPQVSLSGVRGLETLLSGYYIGIQPGDGEDRRSFISDNEPPPSSKDKAGLYLTLSSDSAASVYRGSKLFYRDIEVGEVIDVKLGDHQQQVFIDLHIDDKYRQLINGGTRFWNASGISIKADLPEIDIKFDSLASIIAGGISFYTPADGGALDPGKILPLYSDYEAAEDGVAVTVKFPARTPLSEGTKVVSQEIVIGRIQKLQFNDDLTSQTAHLLIDPRAKPLLRAGSQFWLPKTDFDITQIGQLFDGNAIQLQPGPGIPLFRFEALNTPPAKRPGIPGLDIRIIADQLGSLDFGSPVLYRQVPIGEVRGYELIEQGKKVLIHATIAKEHSALVKANSRFWNISGVKVNAGLDGIKLDTGSLTSVIKGGISFFTPEIKELKNATPNQNFRLYQDFDTASLQGKLIYKNQAGKLQIRLVSEQLGSVKAGSPVLYRQLPVGKVYGYQLAEDGKNVEVQVLIDKAYRHLITSKSRFWNASGIHAQLDLSGLKLQTESIDTIIRGGIAFDNKPGKGKAAKFNQRFTLYPNKQQGLYDALAIQISFPAGNTLERGAELRFQGLKMGRVDNVKLLDSTGRIEARVILDQQAEFLAREGSRFWVTSSQISLRGIKNPEALLSGNYIVASVGNTSKAPRATRFKGIDKAPAVSLPGLNITLTSPALDSIEAGSPVYYRGLKVGQITGFTLGKDLQSIEIYANIQPKYKKLVKTNSRFWNLSGISADFGLFSGLQIETSTLDTLVSGGIAFDSPVASKTVGPQPRFKLLENAP